MFKRFTWYMAGVFSGFYAAVSLYRRARALRRKVTPETMLRAAGLTVADILESVGQRVDRAAVRAGHALDEVAGRPQIVAAPEHR